LPETNLSTTSFCNGLTSLSNQLDFSLQDCTFLSADCLDNVNSPPRFGGKHFWNTAVLYSVFLNVFFFLFKYTLGS
ncbi:hypothetical protein XELAEV_18000111mg, partial [Xenopus laevis]